MNSSRKGIVFLVIVIEMRWGWLYKRFCRKRISISDYASASSLKVYTTDGVYDLDTDTASAGSVVLADKQLVGVLDVQEQLVYMALMWSPLKDWKKKENCI